MQLINKLFSPATIAAVNIVRRRVHQQQSRAIMTFCNASAAAQVRTIKHKNPLTERKFERNSKIKFQITKPTFQAIRQYTACNIDKRMEQHGIVPDVIPIGPKDECVVVFDSGVQVCRGNKLTPTQVKDVPLVKWNYEKGAYYTLIMTDPDAPTRKAPKYKEWHHWLVVNIPNDNVEDGDILSEYVGSGPPKGSGLHRYVFLIYKQPKGKIKPDEKFLDDKSPKGRAHFNTFKFAQKYCYEDPPVAGNFYFAEFDSYVPILYKKLGG